MSQWFVNYTRPDRLPSCICWHYKTEETARAFIKSNFGKELEDLPLVSLEEWDENGPIDASP